MMRAVNPVVPCVATEIDTHARPKRPLTRKGGALEAGSHLPALLAEQLGWQHVLKVHGASLLEGVKQQEPL
jgi:hypothetical protein